MKAAVTHGSGSVKYDTADDPKLKEKDNSTTHLLPLSEISYAYDIFKKREDCCVKVVLDPWQ